jgi:hypothetical protein
VGIYNAQLFASQGFLAVRGRGASERGLVWNKPRFLLDGGSGVCQNLFLAGCAAVL